MATKLNNNHLENIILNSKSYNILDTYITLAHISSEVKNKYLIQTYTNNKADIVNQVKKYVNSSYKTLYNNVDELIRLNILTYNHALSSWSLNDMEQMTLAKSELNENDDRSKLKGYTKIREFFLTSEFQKMKASEKRCLVFLAQLSDSKASSKYDIFTMNLAKPNSKWLQVLKTKCKYYAKSIIENMLDKYNTIFRDESEIFRAKDIAPTNISNFKFNFNCDVVKNIENDNTQFDLISLHHSKELELVKDKVRFSDITLSKVQMMHIVRSVCTLKEWFLKERVVQIIINKFIAIQIHKSREKINSLPAYLVAVVKSTVLEFNEFKYNVTNLRGAAIGLAYKHNICDVDLTNNNYINTGINSILKTI